MSNNHPDDEYPDEPPPSYEEATGTSSSRPALVPPALPPRNPSLAASTTTTAPTTPSFHSTNPFSNITNNHVNNVTSNGKANGNSNTLDIPQLGRRPSAASSIASSSASTTAAAHLHHQHAPAQTFAQLLPAVGHPLHPRQFPPTLNLYRDAFPGALQRRYFVGEHQATPLYAVSAWLATNPSPPHHHYATSSSASFASSLILHNGPSEDAPPLATASYDHIGGSGRRTMHVVLPPWYPSSSSSSPPPPAAQTAPIVVQSESSLLMGGAALAFSFSVPVPWPSAETADMHTPGTVTWRPEPYEWRRSNGAAVSGLGGASHGWKLVRLTNALPPGGRTVAGSGPPSGDGHEVVAVCTNAVMSMTKLWKFSFLGTGLSGVLGERWAVMAVMTGLVIWDRDSRRDGLR